MPRFEELHVEIDGGTDIYKPVRQEGSISTYTCPGYYGVSAVKPVISIATIGAKAKGSIERNTFKVVLPVPAKDASGNNTDVKSHELVAFISFTVPVKATLQQREELLALTQSVLAATNGSGSTEAVATKIVVSGEAIW